MANSTNLLDPSAIAWIELLFKEINDDLLVQTEQMHHETRLEKFPSLLVQINEDSLSKGYKDVPFKGYSLHVENGSEDSAWISQEIAKAIFNQPFSYFNRDPHTFLSVGCLSGIHNIN